MKFDKQRAVAAVAVLIAGACAFSTGAAAEAHQAGRGGSGSSSGSVSSGGDGSVQIAVSAEYVSAAADGSGSGGGGVVSSQSVTTAVHPVCWYWLLRLGADVAAMIEGSDPDLAESLGRIFDGYEQHADDTGGHWYRPTCDYRYFLGDDPRDYNDYVREWLEGRTPVYLPDGQAPPDPVVDGATGTMNTHTTTTTTTIPVAEIQAINTRPTDEP